MKKIIPIILLFCYNSTNAQNGVEYVTEEVKLQSKTLDEERVLTIYRPANLDSNSPITTIYLLDGEWNFNYTKGLIDLLIRWERIPNVALVSIKNVNRTRDFTPSEDEARFPGSGGAEQFLSFMQSELIPHIEETHFKSSNRLIIGHSFGGLFALFVLFEEADLFNGYVAISPSTWWKDKFLFNPEYQNAQIKNHPMVYISTGEFDRGNVASNLEYYEWLKSNNLDDQMTLIYDSNRGESHFSNVSISIHKGLSHYFPGPELKTMIADTYADEGLASLKPWYTELEKSMNGRLIPPTESILEIAAELYRNKKNKDALSLLQWFENIVPDNGNVHYYIGAIASDEGQKDLAMTHYNKALLLNMPERMKIIIRKNIEKLKTDSND
ncbi:alpha/beta hydrolase-fold protein [Fulvivirga lutimaris]|uniref:alpha/beta hydrolase-fold protein n=1 Tax=Fulvivirga lutimaris TaxID=1819566 RepID=UPI0012BC0183|nr:alpha/beta hydrolase-fold protein [Fulvivirga lutimaris]MTI40822.1 alpha/beta hydrolase [Fulvivirga lutimaris]